MVKDFNKELDWRYDKMAEAIKTAILQSQYHALQRTNQIQLQLYYAIGRYISRNSRKNFWGTSALSYISDKLRKDMPGLRGFSETNLKMMRIFYEQWEILDSKSSAVADDLTLLENADNALLEMGAPKWPTTGNFENFIGNEIPIVHFMEVPFSHHYIILSNVSGLQERCFYISLCAVEHLSKDALKKPLNVKNIVIVPLFQIISRTALSPPLRQEKPCLHLRTNTF